MEVLLKGYCRQESDFNYFPGWFESEASIHSLF